MIFGCCLIKRKLINIDPGAFCKRNSRKNKMPWEVFIIDSEFSFVKYWACCSWLIQQKANTLFKDIWNNLLFKGEYILFLFVLLTKGHSIKHAMTSTLSQSIATGMCKDAAYSCAFQRYLNIKSQMLACISFSTKKKRCYLCPKKNWENMEFSVGLLYELTFIPIWTFFQWIFLLHRSLNFLKYFCPPYPEISFLKTAVFISKIIDKVKTTLMKMRIILWVCYASFFFFFWTVVDDYGHRDEQCDFFFLKKDIVHQGRCGGKTMQNIIFWKRWKNIFVKKLHILKENFQTACVSIISLDIKVSTEFNIWFDYNF